MTRPLHSSPATRGLEQLREDVGQALSAGRFDRTFYDDAMRRVTAEHGDMGDRMLVINAAVEAGVLRSVGEVIKTTPTQRWDPKTRKIVPIASSS